MGKYSSPINLYQLALSLILQVKGMKTARYRVLFLISARQATQIKRFKHSEETGGGGVEEMEKIDEI